MEGEGKNGKKNKGKDVTKDEKPGTELKALVVDDNRLVRVTHQMLLKRVGVKSHVLVENGQEAVNLHRSGESFDLILMDKDMPVMNGIQATKTLRSMGIGSMIIGVSSSHKRTENVFIEAGLDDYYTKPLTVDMLRAILDKFKS